MADPQPSPLQDRRAFGKALRGPTEPPSSPRPAAELACGRRRHGLLPDDALSTRCKEDQATAKKEINYSRTLAKLLGDDFLDPTDVQCRDSGRCVFVDGTAPLYRDAHHLNISGSVLLVGRLKEVLPIH